MAITVWNTGSQLEQQSRSIFDHVHPLLVVIGDDDRKPELSCFQLGEPALVIGMDHCVPVYIWHQLRVTAETPVGMLLPGRRGEQEPPTRSASAGCDRLQE